MRAIIYGAGRRCYDLFSCQEQLDLGLIKYGIEIIGFADGDSHKWGTNIFYEGEKFCIRNIDDFSKREYDNILITTQDKYVEIKDERIKKGYNEIKIYLIDLFFEPYLEFINTGSDCSLYNQWGKIYKTGKSIGYFLSEKGYRRVAVYGHGELTERLVHELEISDIKVEYLLYSNITVRDANIPIYNIDMDFPDVDLIIVTDTARYLEIENIICKRKLIEVISIHELLYRVLKNGKGKEKYA